MNGMCRHQGVPAAFTVSYVPGWAVVAVTRDHRRIGVDAVPAEAGGLERVLPAGSRAWGRAEDLRGRVGGAVGAREWARVRRVPADVAGPADPREPARVEDAAARVHGTADAREWARVEAMLKADGRGLRVDPSRVTVQETEDGWVARIVEPDRRPSGASRVEWRGWDLDGPAGVVLAVVVGAA